MRASRAPPVAPGMSGSTTGFRLPVWDRSRFTQVKQLRDAGIAMLALVLPLMLLLVAVRRGTGVLAAILLLVIFVANV